MPELPDVENFRRFFDRTVLGRKIKDVNVSQTRLLKGLSPNQLKKTLGGKKFIRTERIGKYLLASLGKDEWLAFHFGMTGSFSFESKVDGQKNDYERVGFYFQDGSHLGYLNKRMLGQIFLAGPPDEFRSKKELGPDALELDYSLFRELLGRKSGSIKSMLMDQRVISGIGNVYSDEILFQSGLHPNHRVEDLDEKQKRKLYAKMRSVLEIAIKKQADPGSLPENWLLRHRKKNQGCPGCAGKVHKISVGGRSGYYCEKCQK